MLQLALRDKPLRPVEVSFRCMCLTTSNPLPHLGDASSGHHSRAKASKTDAWSSPSLSGYQGMNMLDHFAVDPAPDKQWLFSCHFAPLRDTEGLGPPLVSTEVQLHV